MRDEVEYRKDAERFSVDDRRKTVRNASRNVFVKSAAGDMRDAADADPVKQCKHRFNIDLRRGEQRFADALPAEAVKRLLYVGILNVKNLSDERKAV